MKDADRTPKGEREFLRFEFELPHPPGRIWRALTEPELLSEWLLPVAELIPEAGASFLFRAPAQPGWDGLVACRFIEIDRERKLSYRWVVGDLDTVVTFTLEPTPEGTRLTLVQEGFRPDQKQNLGGARYGWRMMGDRLVHLLDSIEQTNHSVR